MNGQQSPNLEQCLSRIINFIHGFFDRRDIGFDDDLIKAGVLDSLRTAELVYFLEADFGISFSARILNENTLRTPRTIAEMLTSQTVAPISFE